MQEGEPQKDFLTAYICQKFHLFSGARTPEDDQAILEKIQGHCFADTIKFLSDKLSRPFRKRMIDELLLIEKHKGDAEMAGLMINKVFAKYLEKIPYGVGLLESRLIQTVDSLVDRIVEAKKNV